MLSTFSQRQSDRNMPRANFNTGVTTLAGLNGQEYVGLSLLMIVSLPGMLSDVQLEKKFSRLLWMGMSLYQWHGMHAMRKLDLGVFQRNTRKYITLYNEVVEPQRLRNSPSVGNKFPKLHGLLHFPWQVDRYGSALNFYGAFLESHLKTFVKKPGKRTRRTYADFCKDLANRWSESQHIESILSDLQVDEDNLEDDSSPANNRQLRIEIGDRKLSKPHFTFLRLDGKWHTQVGRTCDDNVSHPQFVLPSEGVKALKSQLLDHAPDYVQKVQCHYELKVKNEANGHQIFRCNPSYRGREWFDWVMISFTYRRRDGSEYAESVPGRLYLWLSHGSQDSSEVNEIYALVRPLKQKKTPAYEYLPFLKADCFNDEWSVVHFDSIESVAYVLPAASGMHQTLQRLSPCGVIKENIDENTFFVSIPQMADWPKLGW